MLMLNRKINEVICIGKDVTVTVARISGPPGNRQVRLAIQAPPSVRVDRIEVRERIRRGQQEGAGG